MGSLKFGVSVNCIQNLVWETKLGNSVIQQKYLSDDSIFH